MTPPLKRFAAVLLAILVVAAAPAFLPAQSQRSYRPALPGYLYSFPRDYFNHPDFETEWWYYTGNFTAADGHRFGFELTFFRRAVNRDSHNPGQNASSPNPWDIHDLYLAHLALSDVSGARFYHTERLERSGPGLAGIDEASGRIWNGNWQVQFSGPQLADQALQAVAPDFELHFNLHSEKPPAIHGENGVSQKAAGAGNASHYISLTRLATRGTLTLSGKPYQVTGLAWMDHEFFTHQLTTGQVGWDWLSIQLDDRTELMLFHIRRSDGSIDPYSAGTYVDERGISTHLANSDFVLQPQADSASDNWKSSVTGATYPLHWKIAIPKLALSLDVRTQLPRRSLPGAPPPSPRPIGRARLSFRVRATANQQAAPATWK